MSKELKSLELRYQRNLGPLTEEECRTLWQKKILIAGCGGLGGHLLEHLLRAGVGTITVCDGDSFDESNLNRQILCTTESVGTRKVEEAARRAQAVNPAVSFCGVPEYLTEENADAILSGHDLVLDGLDSVAGRRILAAACARLGIPLVHGAIQDWRVQVGVIPPGSHALDVIYSPGQQEPKGEAPGCLAFTPAFCAALQAAEGIKLLCGRTSSLENKLLFADLLNQDYKMFSL